MGWMGFSSSSAARHAPPQWWLFALDWRLIGIGRARRRGLSCAATSYLPYHGTRPAGERSTSAVGGWVGLDLQVQVGLGAPPSGLRWIWAGVVARLSFFVGIVVVIIDDARDATHAQRSAVRPKAILQG